MDKITLQLIANGEYDHSEQVSTALSHSDYVQLFDDACHRAAKILGQSQDRESKARIGQLLKVETRKRNLALDTRRFTSPIPMGVFTQDEEELFTRVTVTEHFGRSMQQKPFHPLGYGSVAVKLFVFTPEEQEQEMYRAVCEKTGNDIQTQIDKLPRTRGRDLGHIVNLLALTQAGLR